MMLLNRFCSSSKKLSLSILAIMLMSHPVAFADTKAEHRANDVYQNGSADDLEKVGKHLRQVLKNAGIKVAVVDVKPSKFNNMYEVALAGQPPLQMMSDGRYVIQGELMANPSPFKKGSASQAEKVGQSGSPVSDALRHDLLSNMSALKNMGANIPLYHTAISGVIWGTTTEGMPFLVSDDGRYFTDGEVSVIKDGKFAGLDADFEKKKNQDVFSKLDEKQLIIYPAVGQQKAVIYVATDIDCPYCRRFHRLIPQLNQQGVTVKTIGYPVYESSPEVMRKIWCETDVAKRKQLFNQIMSNRQHPVNAQCSVNHLSKNREVAAGLAVFATPAIFRGDGTLYEASFESPEFLEFLGVDKAK